MEKFKNISFCIFAFMHKFKLEVSTGGTKIYRHKIGTKFTWLSLGYVTHLRTAERQLLFEDSRKATIIWGQQKGNDYLRTVERQLIFEDSRKATIIWGGYKGNYYLRTAERQRLFEEVRKATIIWGQQKGNDYLRTAERQLLL